MNKLLAAYDNNRRRVWGWGVVPLLITWLGLAVYVGYLVWDEHFEKPFSDVQLISVEPVAGGYRVRATFEKNNGDFIRLAPIVYQDGLPTRGGVIKNDQPETVQNSRSSGEQYFDITILTDIPSPEKIIIKVEHLLKNSVGVDFKETNDFIVLDQMQLQGVSK